mgnify:CR=1 FL=1
MAREANITYEQVAAAADELKAKDVKPTSRAVREVLGTGSMATVCKFLEQWKSGQARQSQVTDDSIDQSVARALNAHIATKIQTAISDSTARLADMQGELASVILENERQSNEISDLTVEAAFHKEEGAKLAGQIERLTTDLTTTILELGAERQAAEQARIQLAKAELRLEAVPRIEAEIEKVRAELDVERKSAAKAREEAAELRGRIDGLKEKK